MKQEMFLVTKSLVSLFPLATLLGLSDLEEKSLRSLVKFEFHIKQQVLFYCKYISNYAWNIIILENYSLCEIEV